MKQVIEDILNNMILPEHEDILCGFKVLMPNERFDFLGKTSFESPRITLYFKDSITTTFRLRDTVEELMNEIWNTIYNYTNVATDLYYRKVAFCDDDEVIEESKENITTVVEKNLKALNVLLSLVSWDGLCSIWVDYNPEDEEYEIRSKTTASYFGDNNIEQELGSLEDSISSMGIRVYIYTPWYVENCEDEPEFLNESENKKSNYVNVIKQLVEPFKDEDCVCDIDVSYDEEDDMYGVYVVLGHEELNDNFFSSSAMGFYAKKLRVDINKTIVDYLPIKNLYVGSYGVPNCDWKPYGH
jgi:hypothetical protein